MRLRRLGNLLKSAPKCFNVSPTASLPKVATAPTPKVSSLTDLHQSQMFYKAKLNENLDNGRYQILGQLGGGVYSTVWLAKDQQLKTHIALKILRSDCYGGEHDIFELEILQKVRDQLDAQKTSGTQHMTRLMNHFKHSVEDKEHVCLVTPLSGHNLLQHAASFPHKRIPNTISKAITKQLLLALDFLHTSCNVIHTDLQSNNICFKVDNLEAAVESSLSKVKAKTHDPLEPPLLQISTPSDAQTESVSLEIIDFGVCEPFLALGLRSDLIGLQGNQASWVNKRLTDNIQPEHLRAPEVILRAPWGTPVDIWSLGCIVMEFVKGHVAFLGSASKYGTWTSEDDHLAQYMEVLGPIPDALLRRGTRTAEFFDATGKLHRIPDLKRTNLKDHMDGTQFPLTRPEDMSVDDVPLFVDFLRGALALDPDERKTAAELLKHPWLET